MLEKSMVSIGLDKNSKLEIIGFVALIPIKLNNKAIKMIKLIKSTFFKFDLYLSCKFDFFSMVKKPIVLKIKTIISWFAAM